MGKSFPLTRAIAAKLEVPDDTLQLWMATAVPDNVPDGDIAAFIYQVQRTKLDPMARQIYLVSRYNKGETRGTVQTGIDGYRLIADRTGLYAGNDDPIFNDTLSQYAFIKSGEKYPDTATVSVYKAVNGVVGKFTATAAWSAYYPGKQSGYMWEKMPLLMLGKVAEALALRKAFPAELSGIYTSEEMMQAGETGGVDPTIEALLKESGISNARAAHVIEKFKDVGVSQDDELIVNAIGSPIAEVSDDAEGNDVLRKLWDVAVAVSKGKQLGEALGEKF